MAKGLKVPVGVDKRGRALIESNESNNTKKILKLAFSEGEDHNPFQKLGIDNRLIFSVDNPAFRGKVLKAINQVLSKFTELVALSDNDPITFNETTIDGEVQLTFFYIDLLTNKKEEFNQVFLR